MPTLKQARAVFWDPVLFPDYHGPLKPFVRRLDRTALTCEYVNGSRLTTWGAENSKGIRGQRFSRLVQDEADDIDPDVETAVVEPTFSKSGRSAIWLKTGTPRRGRYGALYVGYRLGQEGSPERQKFIADGGDPTPYVSLRFRSDESPQVDQAWLAGIRRKLIACGKKTAYAREYECDFDASEGLVYWMFEPDFHVRAPDYGVPWTEILVGVDHGWADPGVFVVLGVIGNGRDGICHALEEIYEPERDPTWWAERACEVAWRYRHNRQRWYTDPSRPDLAANIRKAVRAKHPELGARFSVDPAENEIEAGVDAVADRLMPREPEIWTPDSARTGRLFVDPRCENTIRELGLYKRKRDPNSEERFLDDIVDKDNHAMDAARYAVFTRFGGPSKQRTEIPG